MAENLFSVINIFGDCVFFTNERSCIPSEKELKTLLTDGYKIKLNGKRAHTRDIIAFVNDPAERTKSIT